MALGHWLKDYIGPHSGGSGGSGGGSGGGGGTEPLIIHVTDEEVKDPQTQETVGYKTDALASDVYEAWQNGKPIYREFNENSIWSVSSVSESSVVTIYGDEFEGILKADSLSALPFSDGYLIYHSEAGDGGDS